MKTFIEICGWYGTVAIVLAYVLVSFGFLPATSLWYQVLNGTGAAGIIVDAFYKKDYQPGVLNVIWLIVAVIAIARLFM